MINAMCVRELSRGERAVVAVIGSGGRKSIDFQRSQFHSAFDFTVSPEKVISLDFSQLRSSNDHEPVVASSIAGKSNNFHGTAGLSEAQIMFLKTADEKGKSYTRDIARAIVHAVKQTDEGGRRIVDVINLSIQQLDKDNYTEDVNKAIRIANRAGIVVVAAAGNTNNPNIRSIYAQQDGAIAVCALESSGEHAGYSAEGEVCAPGGDRLQGELARKAAEDPSQSFCLSSNNHADLIEGKYIVQAISTTKGEEDVLFCSGTSHSTPLVVATAAMMKSTSKKQGNPLSPQKIEEILKYTASTNKLLNAYAAVELAYIISKHGCRRTSEEWEKYNSFLFYTQTIPVVE